MTSNSKKKNTLHTTIFLNYNLHIAQIVKCLIVQYYTIIQHIKNYAIMQT